MGAHALLSPSSAHRWMRCPGSLAATIDKLDGGSSEAAREGTAAHTLAERALTHGENADFYLGVEIGVPYDDANPLERQIFVVDDEMASQVQKYLDTVRREPGELMVEQKLSMEPVYGVEGQFGTADAVILDYENERIVVRDLKYGRGVKVFAKDNEQALSYGAAALLEYEPLADWKAVTVAIDQPRLNHTDEFEYPVDEIREFIADARERAAKAMALIPCSADEIEAAKKAGGKQCQWCPTKGSCATLARWSHDTVYDAFEDLTEDPGAVREAAEMTAEELAAVWARQDTINGWLKAVQSEAKRRLEAGIDLPGLKLVEGRRGARKWVDESLVEDEFGKARLRKDERYTMKLISPAQAQKLLAKGKPRVWKRLEALITQSEGAPSVAPESDSRPPVVIPESAQFQDETDDSAWSDIV